MTAILTRTVWRYGENVLMNTENLWKVSAYMPPGLSKFVREDDVLGRSTQLLVAQRPVRAE